MEPWDEVLDATQAGPECPQMYNKAVIGTENCLVINVYIPQVNIIIIMLSHEI